MHKPGQSLPFKDTIIVANPGTGKTWEIVSKVMELLENGVPGDEIVCVTFTNKAADEMKTRIIKSASSRRSILDQALQIEVSTIHGYARTYLQGTGVNAEIVSNTVLRYIVFSKLLELGTFDYGQNYLIGTIVPKIENGIRYLKSFGIVPEKIDKKTVIRVMRENLGNAKSSNLTDKAIEVLVRDFITIFSEYEQFKRNEDSMDFNDLLRIFLQRMEERHRKIVLVDEFQDLNRMQVEIVEKLAETRFFVGDRKQSIFGFQGGSLGSFSSFLENSRFDVKGKKINHRSTNNILNYAAEYYLKYSRDEYSRQEIGGLNNPEKGDGEKVKLVSSSDPAADAVGILTELMKSGRQRSGDFAIITRTNSQILKITDQLEAMGIGYSSTIKNKANQTQIDEILAFISGLVSDDPAVISRALLTPFAGLTLKEALELNRSFRGNSFRQELLPDTFRELRELKFGLSLIEQAFSRIVMPISASLGSGYVNSANLTLESSREYLAVFADYTLEGYLDFMALSSEQLESDLKKTTVNVLTVHKAKGLEFDTVIYVPAEIRKELEYFDALTYSIILEATGVDVKQDLLEESLRIDFVALTRPKEELFIVADPRQINRFQLENNFCEESPALPDTMEVKSTKFDEAYSMFVNGRFEDAREKLNQQDKWLEKAIRDYFYNVERLSYSVVDKISDPYGFLRQYILGYREESPYAARGTSFHEIAHRYAVGDVKREEVPKEILGDFVNLESALSFLKKEYRIPPQQSELSIELPLSTIFPENGVPDDVMIYGKIDAVFKGNGDSNEYLIADYKTSGAVKSSYWHQLWLYTRMYQRKYAIPPEKLHGGVIYVGLREKINTGERGYDVQVRDYSKIKRDVVESRVREFLHYMDQPDSFIENLLSKKAPTQLDERLKEILEKNF